MAEPRSAREETPSEERGFDYNRTVALSDGVFAIALTLLVLNIAVPTVDPHSRLGSALLDQGSEFESYALSFAVIALLWVRHHNLLRAIRHIDGRFTAMNLVYLGFVAFLPYPTRVLGTYGNEPAAVVLYAVTVSIVALIGAASRSYALRAQLATERGARELAGREPRWFAPAVFIVSIPIAFASTKVAELFWLLLLIPRLGRQLSRRGG
jgi:uncharacterized membrane protein